MPDPLPYAVQDWGAHPDDNADCCWDSTEFATLKEAQEELAHLLTSNQTVPAYFILVGPGLRDIHRNPTFNPTKAQAEAAAEDAAWRQEIAMEAGMLHGVDAYNDAMGQPLGEGD
jgi:hypothetical protein